MTLLKNFRFGGEGRFNLQVGAEVFNLFNQRIRTLGTAPTGSFNAGSASGPRASGVNVQTAFANVNSPLFNDYSAGIYSGRTVQLRAKFIF